jgi:cobalt-zinc-cadmium efflux system outer membrane protein
VAALVSSAPTAGTGLAADLLRLEEALARARRDSPVLRAAAADVDAARERLAQARVLPANPVVAVELARHRKPDDDGLDRGVSLSQEVEVGGQRGLRVAAARHDLVRAEQLLADRRRWLDGEVRRAFAGLAAADARRTLAADASALATRLAEAARRRASAGDVGATDVQLASIEATRSEQALASAAVERARAVARLAAAMGAESWEPIEVGDAAGDRRAEPPAEERLLECALGARPDLLAAREERARFEEEARLVHRRGWVPNPVLKGFYRQEIGSERIAGGEVSLPIPLWNREQGTEAELWSAAARAGAEVSRLQQDIARQIHLAVLRRTTSAAAWDRYQREALPAAKGAHELIERSYERGYLALTELLVQQDRLLQVRAAAIAAGLDLAEAEAELVEAVGGDDLPCE